MMEALKENSKKIENLNKEKIEKQKKILYDSINIFFNKYKDIKYIAWHQHIPSFNDGDPCVFTMSNLNISFEKVSIGMGEDLLSTSYNYRYANDETAALNKKTFDYYDFKYNKPSQKLESLCKNINKKELSDDIVELESCLYYSKDVLIEQFDYQVIVLINRKGEAKTVEYYE